MKRSLVLWGVFTVASAALGAEPAGKPPAPSASPPRVQLTAADLQLELETEGVQVSPELAKQALPAFTAAVARRIELEDALAKLPQDLLVALDRDPKKDGEAMQRALEALALQQRAGSEQLVTDKRWKFLTSAEAPKGWELAGFDDAQWGHAAEEGAYGVGPWLGATGWVKPPQGQWIWNHKANSGHDRDTVYFRRSFVARAATGLLSITADDQFQVFLDGVPVGQGTDWRKAQVLKLTLTPGKTHQLAIKVVNTGGPGGFIADVR